MGKRLTLFNTVLIRVLLVMLSLTGVGDTLNAFVKVVLDGLALFGFLAFCSKSAMF